MYKINRPTTGTAGDPLAAAIKQEVGAQVCAILPDIESAIQKAVSSAIAPLLEKESGVSGDKMTRDQFCDRFRVSVSTFYNLVNAGILHPQRIGRRVLLDANEVEEKLASGELGKYHRRKMQK